MDKNGLAIVLLFLFMIVSARSNAFNSRKLVTTADPNGSSSANQDSQLSSPPPDEKKTNLSPAEVSNPKDTPTKDPSHVESKGLNDVNTKTSPEKSSDKKLDNGKSQDGKEKVENRMDSKTMASKSCHGNPICSDQKKTVIACIQDFENGSNNLTLVVQNEGDIDVKVNVTFGKSLNSYLPAFKIPGHGTEKVNITFTGDKRTRVILNAGNGDCELQIGQTNTKPIDTPSKSKDPDNTSKPNDVDNPVDGPSKVKDVANPSKVKDIDDPSKVKDVDDATKVKDSDTPSKVKDGDDPSKVKDIDDPSKVKGGDDSSKAKKANSPTNPKESDNASKAKKPDAPNSKEVDDASKINKAETVDAPPKPKTRSVDTNTPISQSNFLDLLSFYSKQVTPIYGAYLAFLVALIIGGSWALCSLKKRRTDNGVPYQELEMGPPESSNAVDVETAEGWDQDWDDDDWDEDKAIRSPGGGIQTKSISSNGLTSRATRKDGWDTDWDN